MEVKALNHALLAAAEGEWSRAESALKSVVREGEETNVMVRHAPIESMMSSC